MRFIKTKSEERKSILYKIFLIAVAVVAFIAFRSAQAQEAEGELDESGGSVGAEVKSGGGSSSNSDREYAKRKSRLNVLETKIKDITKQLTNLIHLKNTGGAAVDEKGKPIDIIPTIASSHRKLKETVHEYNLEKDELKYRYPEEGARIERRYVPLRVQTLEQIEKNAGLDAELTRTKKRIDKKYAIFAGDEIAKPEAKRTPAAESTIIEKSKEAEKESQRIKLSK